MLLSECSFRENSHFTISATLPIQRTSEIQTGRNRKVNTPYKNDLKQFH